MTIRYLELIQGQVSRMASHSFLIKGWSITLAAAIMAFAASASSSWSMTAAVLTSLAFWGLDAFYLRQERLYRALYDRVRDTWPDRECTIGDMSLSTDTLSSTVPPWIRTMGSSVVALFHAPILITVVIVAVVLSQ